MNLTAPLNNNAAAELDQLREAFAPLGAKFFVCEWGFRPAKKAMETDTTIHLYPYFNLKDEAKFKSVWRQAYHTTWAAAAVEKTHQYAWSFSGNAASCRESYADAEGVLLHLKSVEGALKAAQD